jgi:hypothetical protein
MHADQAGGELIELVLPMMSAPASRSLATQAASLFGR